MIQAFSMKKVYEFANLTHRVRAYQSLLTCTHLLLMQMYGYIFSFMYMLNNTHQ